MSVQIVNVKPWISKIVLKGGEEIKTYNINYYFNNLLQTISWSLIFILERFWVLTAPFLSHVYIFLVCKSVSVSMQYLGLFNEN